MNILQVRIMGYPHLDGDHEAVLVIVLTEGQVKDKACYAGIVNFPKDKEDVDNLDTIHEIWEKMRVRAGNLVAGSGAKLSYLSAKNYFPELEAKEYRA